MTSNGADKWYAIGCFEQAAGVYSVLLVEIVQSDYTLTANYFTHPNPTTKSEGLTVAMAAGNVYFVASVTEGSWTGDSGFAKMLFAKMQSSDYSVLSLIVIGKTGVNDHLDEMAVSSDGSAVYLHSAHCDWDGSNHNCEGYMIKLIDTQDNIYWQKKITASDPTNFQAIYATDVVIHDSNVYYTFLYLGDCLIIALDSEGTELSKK